MGFSTGYIALWALTVFQTLVAIGLLRMINELKLSGSVGRLKLTDGSEAPAFAGQDLRSGNTITNSIFSERGGVVLFLSVQCSQCQELAARMSADGRYHAFPIVVMCTGQDDGCKRQFKGLASDIPILTKTNALGLYRVSVFPTAVVVSRDGRILSQGHPRDFAELNELVEAARGRGLDDAILDASRTELRSAG